jgi:hypothetical protein
MIGSAFTAEPSVAADAKRLATAEAQLALAGFQVRELRTGGFWAWAVGRARFCGELEDLEAFAHEVSEVRP